MAFEAASVIEAFAAWSLARVLRSVPSIAGGIGVVELGAKGACSASDGNGGVVAAVCLCRFLRAPTVTLGQLASSGWRRLRPATP